MLGRLFPVDAEWCEWRQEPPLAGSVLVRIGAGADGRLVLTGLRVDGPPTAELLRSIPVGRIEAAANAQLAIAGDRLVPATADRTPHPHPASDLSGGWEVPDPAAALTRPAPQGEAVDGSGRRARRPDSFYRSVAHSYLALAQTSTRPVAELAQTSSVPVTTAHRWVKEARRRGFLPPGRPGKAG